MNKQNDNDGKKPSKDMTKIKIKDKENKIFKKLHKITTRENLDVLV